MTKHLVFALSFLALGMAVHQAAFAQNAEPAGAGASVAVAPQATTATFESWTLRCQAGSGGEGVSKGAGRICELTQGVANDRKQPVAQIAIGIPPTGENAGKRMLMVRLPVNLRFARPVEVVMAGGKTRLPLAVQFCLGGFCHAEATLADDGLVMLRQKPVPKMQLDFVDATGQSVAIPLSLEGFDAAWGAYQRESGNPKP